VIQANEPPYMCVHPYPRVSLAGHDMDCAWPIDRPCNLLLMASPGLVARACTVYLLRTFGRLIRQWSTNPAPPLLIPPSIVPTLISGTALRAQVILLFAAMETTWAPMHMYVNSGLTSRYTYICCRTLKESQISLA
jgi:hypothetical protein